MSATPPRCAHQSAPPRRLDLLTSPRLPIAPLRRRSIHAFVRRFRRTEVVGRGGADIADWVAVDDDGTSPLRWDFAAFDGPPCARASPPITPTTAATAADCSLLRTKQPGNPRCVLIAAEFLKDGDRIDPKQFAQGKQSLNCIWGGGRAWKPWRPTVEEIRRAGGHWDRLADRIERVRPGAQCRVLGAGCARCWLHSVLRSVLTSPDPFARSSPGPLAAGGKHSPISAFGWAASVSGRTSMARTTAASTKSGRHQLSTPIRWPADRSFLTSHAARPGTLQIAEKMMGSPTTRPCPPSPVFTRFSWSCERHRQKPHFCRAEVPGVRLRSAWPPMVGPIPTRPRPKDGHLALHGTGGEAYPDEDPLQVRPWLDGVHRPSGHGRLTRQNGDVFEGDCGVSKPDTVCCRRRRRRFLLATTLPSQDVVPTGRANRTLCLPAVRWFSPASPVRS